MSSTWHRETGKYNKLELRSLVHNLECKLRHKQDVHRSETLRLTEDAEHWHDQYLGQKQITDRLRKRLEKRLQHKQDLRRRETRRLAEDTKHWHDRYLGQRRIADRLRKEVDRLKKVAA